MVIYKVKIQVGYNELFIQEDAKFLSFQIRDGYLFLWFICEPSKKVKRRVVVVYGTGTTLEDGEHVYIGTSQQGFLVWHAFERIE